MLTPILIDREHLIDAASIAYLNHTTSYLHTVNDATILADTRAIANLMMAMRQADGRHSRLVTVKNSYGEEVDIVTENVTELERSPDFDDTPVVIVRFAASGNGDAELYLSGDCYGRILNAIELGQGGPAWVVGGATKAHKAVTK